MKKGLLIIAMLFPVLCFSQIWINMNKASIKKEFNLLKKDNAAIHLKMSDSDNTLLIEKTISKTNRVDYSFQFDKNGLCKSAKSTFDCIPCYTKELTVILNVEKYNWKKINENQYVSKFDENLMIELPTDNATNSIHLIRMEWTKVLYDLLTNN